MKLILSIILLISLGQCSLADHPTLSSSEPEEVASGSPVTLTCTPEGGDHDNQKYVFVRNRAIVRSESRDTTYTISHVNSGDRGTYECYVRTRGHDGRSRNSGYSNEYHLSVVDSPRAPSLTPNGRHEVPSGSSLTMTCHTTTGGSITYAFFRDGHEVRRSASPTYTISSVSGGDYGTYTCSAAGPNGETASTDSLEIVAPPGIIEQLLCLKLKLATHGYIQC